MEGTRCLRSLTRSPSARRRARVAPELTSTTTATVELRVPGTTLEGLLITASEFEPFYYGGVVSVFYSSGGGLIDRTILVGESEVTNALSGRGGSRSATRPSTTTATKAWRSSVVPEGRP